jgi:ABC-type ATPase with predicted acetyltransferase domain
MLAGNVLLGGMSESGQDAVSDRRVTFGETVYDAEGERLGTVRGLDEHGFYVSTAEGVLAMSVEHEAESKAGIKELHWRCWDCGELGRLEATDLPEECPNCGAPKEELYYWQQD